jgi:hypothetical protein
MKRTQFTAFSDELQKIAAHPAVIGAGIGAGITGLSGGMKEWDNRLDEEKHNLSPEQKQKLRDRRQARLATGVGVGTAAGAAVGHYAGKAVKNVANEAKGVAEHGKKLLDSSIDRLGAHYKEPFTHENARRLGEGFKEGATPKFLKRIGSLIRKKK